MRVSEAAGLRRSAVNAALTESDESACSQGTDGSFQSVASFPVGRATLENFGKYSTPAAAAANNQDDDTLPPLAVVMDGWNHASPLFF